MLRVNMTLPGLIVSCQAFNIPTECDWMSYKSHIHSRKEHARCISTASATQNNRATMNTMYGKLNKYHHYVIEKKEKLTNCHDNIVE